MIDLDPQHRSHFICRFGCLNFWVESIILGKAKNESALAEHQRRLTHFVGSMLKALSYKGSSGTLKHKQLICSWTDIVVRRSQIHGNQVYIIYYVWVQFKTQTGQRKRKRPYWRLKKGHFFLSKVDHLRAETENVHWWSHTQNSCKPTHDTNIHTTPPIQYTGTRR